MIRETESCKDGCDAIWGRKGVQACFLYLGVIYSIDCGESLRAEFEPGSETSKCGFLAIEGRSRKNPYWGKRATRGRHLRGQKKKEALI